MDNNREFIIQLIDKLPEESLNSVLDYIRFLLFQSNTKSKFEYNNENI